jgi:hypothetical protein
MFIQLNRRPEYIPQDLGVGVVPFDGLRNVKTCFAQFIASDPLILAPRDGKDLAVVARVGFDPSEVAKEEGLFRSDATTQVLPSGCEGMTALRRLITGTAGETYARLSTVDKRFMRRKEAGGEGKWPDLPYWTALKELIGRHVVAKTDATYTWRALSFPQGANRSVFSRHMEMTTTTAVALPPTLTEESALTYHTSGEVGAAEEKGLAMLRDLLRWSLFVRAPHLTDPETLKSRVINADQLTRDDQARAIHLRILGILRAFPVLPALITDALFEQYLALPLVGMVMTEFLDRTRDADRFARASAITKPFHVGPAFVQAYWEGSGQASVTIDGVTKTAQEVHALPWWFVRRLLKSTIYGRAAGNTAAEAQLNFNATSIKGMRFVNARFEPAVFFGDEDDFGCFLKRLFINRLRLADELSGPADAAVVHGLKWVISRLGLGPIAPRKTPLPTNTFAGTPDVFDGMFTTTTGATSRTALLRRVTTPNSAIGEPIVMSEPSPGEEDIPAFPIPHPEQVDEMGHELEVDPEDYALLSQDGQDYGLDNLEFDVDAQIVQNAPVEWARRLGLSLEEFTKRVTSDYVKWQHLLVAVKGADDRVASYKARGPLAITSNFVRRITRSTLIDLPSGGILPSYVLDKLKYKAEEALLTIEPGRLGTVRHVPPILFYDRTDSRRLSAIVVSSVPQYTRDSSPLGDGVVDMWSLALADVRAMQQAITAPIAAPAPGAGA